MARSAAATAVVFGVGPLLVLWALLHPGGWGRPAPEPRGEGVVVRGVRRLGSVSSLKPTEVVAGSPVDREFRALLHGARDAAGTVVLTFATANMARLLGHFLCTLEALHLLPHFVLLALDNATYHLARAWPGVRVFFNASDAADVPRVEERCLARCRTVEAERGTKLRQSHDKLCRVKWFNSLTYLHVVHLKSRYQYRALEAGVAVFMLDVDISLADTWREGLPAVPPGVDFVAQKNRPCAGAGGPAPIAGSTADFNTGVFLARPSAATLAVFRELIAEEDRLRRARWQDPADKDVLGDDQSLLMEQVSRMGPGRATYVADTTAPAPPQTGAANASLFSWGYFAPANRFPDGSCFEQLTAHSPSLQGLPPPLLFHANFRFGALQKEEMLRAVGGWRCPAACAYTALCAAPPAGTGHGRAPPTKPKRRR